MTPKPTTVWDPPCPLQRKREDAVAELREALRLRPDYPEAQQLLHRLER